MKKKFFNSNNTWVDLYNKSQDKIYDGISEICEVALIAYIMPLSNASVERSFSVMSYILNEYRNRLSTINKTYYN